MPHTADPIRTDPMRDVRRWLWAVAGLVAAMVMLGGARALPGPVFHYGMERGDGRVSAANGCRVVG